MFVEYSGEHDVGFEVTVYFLRKFEATRKFFCGNHQDFINSISMLHNWHENSGGKTGSPFYKSFDKKYVVKELKQ